MLLTAHTDNKTLFLDVKVDVGTEDLYIQDRTFDWYELLDDPHKNPTQPTTALAYLCHGEDGVAFLLGDEGPGPQGNIMPNVPRRPWATKVLAGTTYENRLALPLPLLEWYAYALPAAKPTIPVIIKTLRYRLAYFRASRVTTANPVARWPGTYDARGKKDYFDATAGAPESITLLVRQDAFTRFAPKS